MTKKRPSAALGSISELIELRSEMVGSVRFAKTVCRDADDDKLLVAAVAPGADYVVIADAVLLKLKNHQGIQIAGWRRFTPKSAPAPLGRGILRPRAGRS